jgi:hypothetical protein
VFLYRVLALWLPMPVSLAVIPALQQMGQRLAEPVPEPVRVPEE